jgi:hypothetical protein
MDWIGLAQDGDQWRTLVKMVMKLQVPLNFGNLFSGCTTGGFSRMAQLFEVSCDLCNISVCETNGKLSLLVRRRAKNNHYFRNRKVC